MFYNNLTTNMSSSIYLVIRFFAIFYVSTIGFTEKAYSQQNISKEMSADNVLQLADKTSEILIKGSHWIVGIQSDDGKKQVSQKYKIYVKQDSVLAECLDPAKHKGEKILFSKEKLWFYKPGISQPIMLSARQKLSGQAANGDIALTRFARDYTAVIEGEETVDGVLCYRLLLTAKNRQPTYDKVKYWVSKDKKIGVKADFMTKEGTVLKHAKYTYGNSISHAGKKYPFWSQMDITDAVIASKTTKMTYESVEIKNLQDSLFSVESLFEEQKEQ